MSGVDLNKDYSDLLATEHQRTLVKVAQQIFANVVRLSVTAKLIDEPDLNQDMPSELKGTGELFSTEFRLTAALGSEEVRYARLGHQFNRYKKRLGSRPDNLFRKRSEMVPSLYRTLWQHRNIIAHEYDAGTVPRVVGLCGTILGILELSPAAGDESEELRRQCEEAVWSVAEGMKSQHGHDLREQGTTRDNQAEAEKHAVRTLEKENLKHERQRDVPESRQRRTLSLPDARTNTATRLDRIETTVDQIASRLEEVGNSAEKGLAVTESVASDLDRSIELTKEALARVERKVLLYEDEVPDFELDEPDLVEDEPNLLTVSMAKEKLRALRDRIERETAAKPWENICMMNPIVRVALGVASKRGLADIDDWRALPIVQERYGEHSVTMDRQLEVYGEAMMEVYKQVEESVNQDFSS